MSVKSKKCFKVIYSSRDKCWDVFQEGREGAVSSHYYKNDAVEDARSLAMTFEGMVVIYNEEGAIDGTGYLPEPAITSFIEDEQNSRNRVAAV